MASDGQTGQHTQQNDEYAFLVALIAAPILIICLWHFFGRYVYSWERVILYGILSLWGTFPVDWPVLGWLTRHFLFFRYTPAKEIEFAADAVPDSLIVNSIVLTVMLFVIVKRVLYITTYHPFNIFGRTINLYDYVEQQMPLYPHLRVMWRLRLLGRPLHEGLFRMGDSAKEFAIRNGLVKLPALTADPVLDEKKTKRVCEKHLGMMLPMPTKDPLVDAKRCIARLDNNEKALLAAIVPRLAVCDAKVTDQEFEAALAKSSALVTQYWVGFDDYRPALPTQEAHERNPDMPLEPPPPEVDTSGCDAVLLKYLVFPRVRESMLAHAYVRTFIYDALQACRRVGKFSPTRFRWLRMKDRALWLLIDSAGRNTPYWEVAGAHGHYLWERKAVSATEKPHVEEVVSALREELDAMLFSKDQKDRIWAQQGAVPVALVPAPRKELARSTERPGGRMAKR
jgi:hypothetical protein